MEICERARARKLDRGKPALNVAVASLYTACRNTGSTTTLKEISKASGIRIRILASIYRLLLNELEFQATMTDPAICVAIVAVRSGVNDEKTKSLALKILKDRGVLPSLAGKDRMGLAAAALYMACLRSDVEKSQEEISKAAGVTEVTIRNRSMEMKLVMEERGMIKNRLKNSNNSMLNDWPGSPR